ncbi:MAG TPA: response regulator [Thermoanaerobaculia bacterium]|nr:response regulator [Thermoanaerobaculia bacterium]
MFGSTAADTGWRLMSEPGPTPGAEGAHVLYLDNDEAQVYLAKLSLERRGFRVSGFTVTEVALRALLAASDQFDIVVTDLNMPGRSGIDVAIELARLYPSLPVLVASAYVTEKQRRQALEAGIEHLIEKPSSPQELGAAVEGVLRVAASKAAEG